MRFSKKSINKTIAQIDRYFTWDDRSIGNGTFEAYDHESHKYVSFHPFRSGDGYWFWYDNNGHIYHRVIKTYRDLNELNKLIKVMF